MAAKKASQSEQTNLRMTSHTGDILNGLRTLRRILRPQATHPRMRKPHSIIVRVLRTLNQHHRPDPRRRTLIMSRIRRIMGRTLIMPERTTRGHHSPIHTPIIADIFLSSALKFCVLGVRGRERGSPPEV